jgi:hypothetical protein
MGHADTALIHESYCHLLSYHTLVDAVTLSSFNPASKPLDLTEPGRPDDPKAQKPTYRRRNGRNSAHSRLHDPDKVSDTIGTVETG